MAGLMNDTKMRILSAVLLVNAENIFVVEREKDNIYVLIEKRNYFRNISSRYSNEKSPPSLAVSKIKQTRHECSGLVRELYTDLQTGKGRCKRRERWNIHSLV